MCNSYPNTGVPATDCVQMGIVLIFTFGARSPGRVVSDIFADITTSTLIDARAQGVFGDQP